MRIRAFTLLAFLGLGWVGPPASWAQTKSGNSTPTPTPKALLRPLGENADQPAPSRHSVNLLADGAQSMLLVRDQEATSYCFAVAATALFDAWNWNHSPQRDDYRRSCSIDVAEKTAHPKGGGDVQKAIDYLLKNGACQSKNFRALECVKTHGPLEKYLSSACDLQAATLNRVKPPAQPQVLMRSRESLQNESLRDDFYQKLLHQIDSNLNQNLPVIVSLCNDHLEDNAQSNSNLTDCYSDEKNKRGLHASLVVGRECDTVERGHGCSYLVHLFQGPSTDETNIKNKYRSRKPIVIGSGAIWMTEQELLSATFEGIALVPKKPKVSP